MNLIITGSSIPLANYLKKKIYKKKQKKINLVSIINNKQIKKIYKNEKILNQDFGKSLSSKLKKELKKCDYFIHLGWQRYSKFKNTKLINLDFIKKCKKYLNQNCKIIFLSSVSVYGNYKSIYSTEKKKVEIYLIKNFANVAIIYSGLILNKNYGSYKRLKNLNNFFKIPFYFGKYFYLLSTKEKDLVNIFYVKLIRFKKGKYFVYNRNEIYLDQFIKKRLKMFVFRFKLNHFITIKILKFLNYLNHLIFESKFFDDLQNFFGDNPWNIIIEEKKQKN